MKRSLFSPIEDVRQQVLLLPRCADSEDLSAVPAVTRHRWTVQYAHSQLDQQDKHQRCIRRKGRKTKEANTHTQKTVLSMGLKCGSDGAWYYSWSPGKVKVSGPAVSLSLGSINAEGGDGVGKRGGGGGGGGKG